LALHRFAGPNKENESHEDAQKYNGADSLVARVHRLSVVHTCVLYEQEVGRFRARVIYHAWDGPQAFTGEVHGATRLADDILQVRGQERGLAPVSRRCVQAKVVVAFVRINAVIDDLSNHSVWTLNRHNSSRQLPLHALDAGVAQVSERPDFISADLSVFVSILRPIVDVGGRGQESEESKDNYQFELNLQVRLDAKS